MVRRTTMVIIGIRAQAENSLPNTEVLLMPPVEDFSKNQEVCGPFDPKKGPIISHDVLSRIYSAIIDDFKGGTATAGRGMTEKMDYKEAATYNLRGGVPEAIVNCGNGKKVDIKFVESTAEHLYPSISVELEGK